MVPHVGWAVELSVRVVPMKHLPNLYQSLKFYFAVVTDSCVGWHPILQPMWLSHSGMSSMPKLIPQVLKGFKVRTAGRSFHPLYSQILALVSDKATSVGAPTIQLLECGLITEHSVSSLPVVPVHFMVKGRLCVGTWLQTIPQLGFVEHHFFWSLKYGMPFLGADTPSTVERPMLRGGKKKKQNKLSGTARKDMAKFSWVHPIYYAVQPPNLCSIQTWRHFK